MAQHAEWIKCFNSLRTQHPLYRTGHVRVT